MGKWKPAETAPKKPVWKNDGSLYGKYIIGCDHYNNVTRVRWWQSESGEERFRNFLDDGGNAFGLRWWQPLPRAPRNTEGSTGT